MMRINKIIKFGFLSVIIGCASNPSIAQNTVGGVQAGGVDANPMPGGIIQEIKASESANIRGTGYFSENWQNGKIEYLTGQVVEKALLRYNVENEVVEVKVSEDKIIVIDEGKLRAVQFSEPNRISGDCLFKNGIFFQIGGVPLVGLYRDAQIKGRFNLVVKYYLKIIEPTYVKTLDSGIETTTLSVEPIYYLADGKELVLLKKGKKKIISQFDDEVSDELSAYVKKNKVIVKSYEGLYDLIEFANTLDATP